MSSGEDIFFIVKTPLNINVRTTVTYWSYLTTMKHPVMNGKEGIVQYVLREPSEIRQSKTDKEVYLYYKQFDKLYCVVARHLGSEGFLITAYPTDKVKEGDAVWKK